LHPVNVPNFTIPFEIGESASSIREVALLVSKDRGRHWLSVDRQPVEKGKFAFHADSDGEYWFAFRTATTTGNAPSNAQPQLRVLVNAKETIVLPSQPSDTGPLTPPKPQRYRTGSGDEPKLPPQQNQSQLAQPTQSVPSTKTDEAESSELTTNPAQTDTEKPPRMRAPKLPGFELPEPGRKQEGNLLDDLLSGMSPYMDVQPAMPKSAPPQASVSSKSNIAPAVPNSAQSPVVPSPVDLPAGGISGIVLNPTETGSQIVVRWNTGRELWRDAQIDVLRSGTPEGPWSPIAINLPNSGEYWWFITPEDLKPFHVAVRIRSVEGGIQQDVTKSAITIDPRLSQFQRPRP
jgi:hypothetical protein